MRIGLTYDLQTNPHDERQAEFDPPRTIDAVCQALSDLGHEAVRLGGAFELLRNPKRLAGIDLIFNIAEGGHGRCREAWVPNLLELHGVPWVGSDTLALSLGLDKVTSKQLAVASGVPTPRWMSLRHPADLPPSAPLRFPVIVKPRAQGSGIGIDPGAVVHDDEALRHRARDVFTRWPEPLLIEEFVPAGELTILLIGNDPPTAYPAIQRPIDPATRLSYHIVHRDTEGSWEAPLTLSEPFEARARHLAQVMFEALGCWDVARVDFRVDDRQRLWFLEINPLPSYDPEGTFGLLAAHLGFRYRELIGRVVDAALDRLHSKIQNLKSKIQP
jgi:D-alanine-D-alanine ligase